LNKETLLKRNKKSNIFKIPLKIKFKNSKKFKIKLNKKDKLINLIRIKLEIPINFNYSLIKKKFNLKFNNKIIQQFKKKIMKIINIMRISAIFHYKLKMIE
jgi:hypothetical protein